MNRVRFADDHQHLHAAGVDVGDELAKAAFCSVGTISGVGT